jgi:hypothetical protein
MAEARATKRGKGRPRVPVSDKFLLYLSALEAGPLTQKEIRVRTELRRATVSRYSTRYPHFVEKTPNGYSLTVAGRYYIVNLEIQQTMNKTISFFSRAFKGLAPYMIPIIEAGEKIMHATEYLEKKADIVSRHPKFKGVQDPVLRARAVDALLEGMLCYACFNPKIVNETGSLEHFLNAWDNEGRTFCKKCGLELSKGGGDISSAFAPPRKRFKRAIKDDKDEGIGSVEPDSEELRKFRERYETKARGS